MAVLTQDKFNSLLGSALADNAMKATATLLAENKSFIPSKLLQDKIKVMYPDIFDKFLAEPRAEDLPPHLLDIKIAQRYLNKAKDAASRGLDFDLTFSDFKNMLRRKTCYYTGLRLDDQSEDLSPSIERIDNSKGYLKGNTVVVAKVFNKLKSVIFEGRNKDSLQITIKNMKDMIAKMEKAGLK